MKTNDLGLLIEKNFQGSLVASAIIHGRRIHRVYYGYSRDYVRKDFTKYAIAENSKQN